MTAVETRLAEALREAGLLTTEPSGRDALVAFIGREVAAAERRGAERAAKVVETWHRTVGDRESLATIIRALSVEPEPEPAQAKAVPCDCGPGTIRCGRYDCVIAQAKGCDCETTEWQECK